jgi:hypothetical protein
MNTGQQAPRQEFRRFDIFAEWNRLKAQTQQHFSDAEAQSYGLAVAKVVAARKFAGHRPGHVRDWKQRATREDFTEAWWTHLGSVAEFEDKIVARMGKSFYRRVFPLCAGRGRKASGMSRSATRYARRGMPPSHATGRSDCQRRTG